MIRPSKIVIILMINCLLAISVPNPASASFVKHWIDKGKKTIHDAKEAAESVAKKAADEVEKEAAKGVTDVTKLSKKTLDFVKSKWRDLEKPILDQFKSTKVSSINVQEKYSDNPVSSKNTYISVSAVNNANITVLGGFRVGIKVGYKGFSHTFHKTFGNKNNQVNYNCVIIQSDSYNHRQIRIDSTIGTGDHHFYGTDADVATVRH